MLCQPLKRVAGFRHGCGAHERGSFVMERAVSRLCIAPRIVGGVGLTVLFLEREFQAFAIHLGAHGLQFEFFEKCGGFGEIGVVMFGEAELGGVHDAPLLDEFCPAGGEKDENVVGADA